MLEKFAGYGFNKSHAAAYAVVAYQTAYLKANYPVEFLSAMMTNDMGDTGKLSILIGEGRTLGVETLGPDVNESGVYFTPATLCGDASRNGKPEQSEQPAAAGEEKKAIRFGLVAIKGVGEIAVQSILEARKSGGKFKSLGDLCERVDGRTVNRKVLEALIKSGACDCFGENRATLFGKIDRVLTRAAGIIQDRQRGQDTLFGMLEKASASKPEPDRQLPEWPQAEMLANEKELLGFYVSGHPLNPLMPIIDKYALHKTGDLAALPARSLTRIAGMISAVQKGISKKSNKPYAMVTLEDLEGSVQVLCMNENYDKYLDLLVPNKAILLVGEVNNAEDKPKIFPQELMALEDAPKKYTRQVHFRLLSGDLKPEDLDAAKALVDANPGRCPVFLCIKSAEGKLVFIQAHDKYGVCPSLGLQTAVEERFGKDSYYAKVDMTLPERAARRWEKKSEDNGD